MGNAFSPQALTGILTFLITTALLMPAQASTQESESKRSLDFDDSLVEGMNRKPLDSVSHLGSNSKQRRSHLYELREDFLTDTRRLSELLREVR